MRRQITTPRTNWQKTVEEQGLIYHTPDGQTYWDESAYYEFSLKEVEMIEQATEDLYQMCLQAAEHVVERKRYAEFGIPAAAVPFLERAWESEPPSVYGRFDLAYDGKHPPKLLEFNADTPTALLEAAVIQWYWRETVLPKADQFNSIHEKLIAKWKDLSSCLQGAPLHFCHMDDWEDFMTVSYLRDTASQAGIASSTLLLEELGWDTAQPGLYDLDHQPIRFCFKLYPWEWLLNEIPSGGNETFHQVTWIEPVWKMLWSNKAILALLWELFPNHPNLLPAYLDGPRDLDRYVQKPLLSREGANIQIVTPETKWQTDGPYSGGKTICQAFAPIPEINGNYPILGSWYVTDQGPAGMGIRESKTLVTDNRSRFVPHAII